MTESNKKPDSGGQTFRKVLGFTFRHWSRQPVRVAVVALASLFGALADVLTPHYAGQLVDALTRHETPGNDTAWHTAVFAFWALTALGLGGTIMRQAAYRNIISLTLKMMSEIATHAFHRVQRFSTDWHANSFAGSTVRKITRGIWALWRARKAALRGSFAAYRAGRASGTGRPFRLRQDHAHQADSAPLRRFRRPHHD
jgi:ATP-binding cassette subfamily B protein